MLQTGADYNSHKLELVLYSMVWYMNVIGFPFLN